MYKLYLERGFKITMALIQAMLDGPRVNLASTNEHDVPDILISNANHQGRQGMMQGC
jgi:hypothetical protein